MQKVSMLLATIVFSNAVFAQTNVEKFQNLFDKHDTTAIRLLLSEWESKQANDPELYTSAANFYFSNSRESAIAVRNEPSETENLALVDSASKEVRYLTSGYNYDPDQLNKAISYLNQGIEKFPDRLDIRFGKCYILGEIEDYTGFTNTIIETVQRSGSNKNNWLWTGNKKQKDGKNFMLTTIHSYMRQIYDTENDNLLPNIIQIGERTLAYYPKGSIEILSTTSVALMLTNENDKAIGYLKQAEQLNAKDFIVLNNIAEVYKRKGDKVNAIKYYELTAKYGDEQAKNQARQNIDQLKK